MNPAHFRPAITLATILFAFSVCSATDVEYANKTYKTAKIGTQTWLAENLNYEAEGSKCYENNPANCAKYGRLYNWETAMKVCPKGWHLPSNAEWDELYRFIDHNIGSERPYKSRTAGKHLKAVSSWNSYRGSNGNGTDYYGFSALPCGFGNSAGFFYNIGYSGLWW
jgi:uncharacterized protein (TIGR02145 family)